MAVANKIKGIVSKKKRRYQEDGFDLDLTYICQNIIAMGFPAVMVEGIYRNNISEVVRFLDTKHRDHYKVYNLCSERSYDQSRFHNRVQRYPFDDHHPPRFELIGVFCADVDQWLAQHPSNVAVVHCKAGKGRTGVMVCAYLLHRGKYQSHEQALRFYGETRTRNKEGVTIPSQIRYVWYYSLMLSKRLTYQRHPLVLLTIRLINPFTTTPSSLTNPSFIIKHPETIHYQSEVFETLDKSSSYIDLPIVKPLVVCGDFLVEFQSKFFKKKSEVFHFWLNSFFIFDKQTLQPITNNRFCSSQPFNQSLSSSTSLLNPTHLFNSATSSQDHNITPTFGQTSTTSTAIKKSKTAPPSKTTSTAHQTNGISKEEDLHASSDNPSAINTDTNTGCCNDVKSAFDKNKDASLCTGTNSSSADQTATKNIHKNDEKRGEMIAEKLMNTAYWNNNDVTCFDSSLVSQTSFQHQYSCPTTQDDHKNVRDDDFHEDNKDSGLENMTEKFKSFFNSNRNLNLKSDKPANKSDWWDRIRTKAKTCLRMTTDKKELGWKSRRAESSSSDTVVCIGNESNLQHLDLSRFQTHHLTDPNLLKHTEQIDSIPSSCSLQNSNNDDVNEKINFTCEESVSDNKSINSRHESSRESSRKHPIHPNDVADLTNSTFSSLKQAPNNNTQDIQFLSFNENRKIKSKNDLTSNYRDRTYKTPRDEKQLLLSEEVFDSLKTSSYCPYKTVTLNKNQLDFANKSSDHKLFSPSFKVQLFFAEVSQLRNNYATTPTDDAPRYLDSDHERNNNNNNNDEDDYEDDEEEDDDYDEEDDDD